MLPSIPGAQHGGKLTKLLQGRHTIGVIMVLLYLSLALLHLLTCHTAHRLFRQFHAADNGLKALVGEGWFLPIQLNDPEDPR